MTDLLFRSLEKKNETNLNTLSNEIGNEVLTTTSQTIKGAINELKNNGGDHIPNWYDLSKYNAVGDNVTDSSPAFNSCLNDIGTKLAQLYVPDGTYKLSENITIPSNVELILYNGALLSLDPNVTLTINGYIRAGEYPIFEGNGIVTGSCLNKKIYVKWFSLDETASNDVSTPLQQIITLAQNSKARIIFPNEKKYKILQPLTAQYGKNADADVSKTILIEGNNCIIYPQIDGAAFKVDPLCTQANKANGWGIAYLDIKGLQFDNYFGNVAGYLNSQAIVIGKDGYVVDGFIRSQLNKIFCTNFPKNAIEFINTRFLDGERISIRGGSGIKVGVYSSGSFSGDMNFKDCDFSAPMGKKTLELYGYAPSGGAYGEVRGIHFSDCVFYGSDTHIEASTQIQIGDIWFDDCAWDNGVNAFNLYANLNSHLFNIFLVNPYITSFSGIGIQSQTDGVSWIQNLQIKGGVISVTGTGANIYLLSNEEALIDGVSLDGGSGEASILCDTVTKTKITNCIQRNTTKTNFVTIGNNSSDFAITNNMNSKPINDYSGAVNKLVTNNLTISNTIAGN